MAKERSSAARALNYGSIPQGEVPQGRNGKHHATVEKIMSDLEQLAPGRAMKIELARLPDSKENIRSALNRETRLRGIRVSTASDEDFLYVWRVSEKARAKGTM